MTRSITLVFLVLASSFCPAAAESLLNANYDIRASLDGVKYHAQNRVRVKDGHTIPTLFQEFRIDLKIAENEDTRFEISIEMFQKSQGEWFRIDVGDLSFGGELGIPVEYRWSGGGIAFDIAIGVSRTATMVEPSDDA